MTNRTAESSPLVYARVAGAAYLLITIAGALGVGFLDSKLVVSGDHAATANNIIANGLLFRLGIVAVLIIYASVVVATWAFYVLLKRVDKNLALLAMLLRLVEAIVGAATVLLSFVVILLLEGSSTTFETEHVQALVGLFLEVRTAGLDVVLIFVGLGGAVFCYLFFKSKYVPRPLAAWGLFTYLSMLALALVSILVPNHPDILEYVLYALGGLFELIFALWLLFKGINIE